VNWVVFAVAEKCPCPRDKVGMTSRAVSWSAEVRELRCRIVVAADEGLAVLARAA
jgi:hypothetical protein